MARLIDADKLIEEFNGRCICECDSCKYQNHAHCGLIDNAPTVNGDIDAIDRSNAYHRGYHRGYHNGIKVGKALKEGNNG